MKPKYVDHAPSWIATLLRENASARTRQSAFDALMLMARLADTAEASIVQQEERRAA